MIGLNVISLAKQFGNKKVFSDLSFSATSAVVGIAGRNGSGKTTLMKCIAGLLKPASGRIEWQIDEKPVNRQAIKHEVGYVAPYVELYEELTVFENLRFVMDLRNWSLNGSSINDILNRFDAGGLSENYFGSLSTGQRQRIKLAAAIIHQPRILMLDEPGSNLDRKGKQAVEEMVNQHRNPHSMVLLASNLKDELDLCDQIIELKPTA